MSREGAFPLHVELPWFGYASEGAVLTKRGELLAAARLRGAPFECRAADDLDSVALRWTLALKSLAPGWRIRWHARKRRLAALPQRVAGDALFRARKNTRNAALIGKGLYSIEASVYWLWDPRPCLLPTSLIRNHSLVQFAVLTLIQAPLIGLRSDAEMRVALPDDLVARLRVLLALEVPHTLPESPSSAPPARDCPAVRAGGAARIPATPGSQCRKTTSPAAVPACPAPAASSPSDARRSPP